MNDERSCMVHVWTTRGSLFSPVREPFVKTIPKRTTIESHVVHAWLMRESRIISFLSQKQFLSTTSHSCIVHGWATHGPCIIHAWLDFCLESTAVEADHVSLLYSRSCRIVNTQYYYIRSHTYITLYRTRRRV